jgi:hypothetical protein
LPGGTASSSALHGAEVCGSAADAACAVSASNGSAASRRCIEALGDSPHRLCAVCRVGVREVGLVHGDEMCLCLCKGCAAGYGCGSACPMCGQVVQEQLEI